MKRKGFLISMVVISIMSTFMYSSFAMSDTHNVKTENGVIATFVESARNISMFSSTSFTWNHQGYTTTCSVACCNRYNDVVVAETTCVDHRGRDVKHYSRARKEFRGRVVDGIDSDRRFGVGESKATSPHFPSLTLGTAKTYYGIE